MKISDDFAILGYVQLYIKIEFDGCDNSNPHYFTCDMDFSKPLTKESLKAILQEVKGFVEKTYPGTEVSVSYISKEEYDNRPVEEYNEYKREWDEEGIKKIKAKK